MSSMPPTHLRWFARPARPRGAILVMHGGAVEGRARNRPWSHNVARLVPFALRLRRDLGSHVAVAFLRFEVRGWNGADQSPVAEARAAVDQIRTRYPDVPVVLVGHSMGARTALHVGDEVAVTGIVGLAPWIEWGDPAERVAGATTVLVHGDRDVITPLSGSRRFVERHRAAGHRASLVRVAGGEHTMLRRAGTWHALASALCRELVARSAQPADGGGAPARGVREGGAPARGVREGGIGQVAAAAVEGNVPVLDV